MTVFRDRTDITVGVRIKMTASLAVIQAAGDDMPQVRDHACCNEKLPLGVVVDTPRIAKTVRNNFKHFLSWVIAPDTTINLLTLPFKLDRLGIWLTMLEKLPSSLWLTYDRRREHALAAVYPAVRPPVQTVEHLVPVANAPPGQPHLDIINISFVVFVSIWNE